MNGNHAFSESGAKARNGKLSAGLSPIGRDEIRPGRQIVEVTDARKAEQPGLRTRSGSDRRIHISPCNPLIIRETDKAEITRLQQHLDHITEEINRACPSPRISQLECVEISLRRSEFKLA